MEPALRSRFNADFTSEKYAALLRCVNETEKWPADFRVSETPIFLTEEFTDEVTRAANAIVDLVRTPEFVRHSGSAIPKNLEVPDESVHPNFLVVDFGICLDGDRLLLEIEPEKQKTRIDFAATESLLGIRSVCLTKISKRGRQLFYDRDGRAVRIGRIYNRVIFDELLRRPELGVGFGFHDRLDVTWVGHPNWYFRISKHSLPFLKTEHTAPAFFADQFPADEKIDNYVLKPLYSFAGLGVEMEPTREKLSSLEKPREWILQKKVDYASFVPTVDGPKSKAEIRMMFVWPEGDRDPTLVNNLVRMSQGKMMGVNFNKDKTWVGSSIALHED